MKHTVAVPASQQEVRSFIEHYRQRFTKDLDRLRSLLDDLKKSEPSLRNAYKIYSRGDAPNKDELKGTKKIRLKFNNFNLKNGVREASLFDVPDIVGLTIVVTYPSDINDVVRALDAAVDREDLIACRLGESDPGAPFSPAHGRAITSKGYFACHYNFRMPGASDACPIIEVQIKTVLHDAWGVKTHDLTYKPVGRIGDELLTSFDLLGENLANLDRQSDAMRQSIVQTFAVRDLKRRRVQTWVLLNNCNTNIEQIPDDSEKVALRQIRDKISAVNPDTQDGDAKPILASLLKYFKSNSLRVASSVLLCYLAAKIQRAEYFDRAQEAIADREEKCADGLDRVGIRFEGALAAFAGGDVAEAIDVAEEALQLAEELKLSAVTDQGRFERILLGLNSDLAYYYADLIGSHEGNGRDAVVRARHFMGKAIGYYRAVGLPSEGIRSANSDIAAALQGPHGVQAFFSLDNEAYVCIQTAGTPDDIRSTEKRLDFIHGLAPSGLEESVLLASDYHDYCARMRLAELERGRVP